MVSSGKNGLLGNTGLHVMFLTFSAIATTCMNRPRMYQMTHLAAGFLLPEMHVRNLAAAARAYAGAMQLFRNK